MRTRIETASAGRIRMDYFRFGKGERNLVILPGLSVESVMKYADTVAEAYQPLADEFTIYVLDRRKELPPAYSVDAMAEDTAAVIRTLMPGPACLFGASQGGMIAMAAAAGYPELADRLVLASTSARVTAEQYRTIESWVRTAKSGDAGALCLSFAEAVYPPEVFEQAREQLAAGAESVTEEDLRRFVILAEGTKGFDAEERLQRIACPVLLTGSRDDRVLGCGAAQRIADRLEGRADFEYCLYDGFGHAAYDTAPDYKERMLRFLTRKFSD